MKNLMLDIETLGTTPGSAILSISAVQFADDGTIGQEFHADIRLQSCIELGLTIDADTVLWWMKQNEYARSQFTDDRERLGVIEALFNFYKWYTVQLPEGVKVFAKDPDFDCSLMEDAYRKAIVTCPFKYYKKMSIRTLSSLRPEFEANEEFTGVPHNGIDDCKHQIKYVVKILKDLQIVTTTKVDERMDSLLEEYKESLVKSLAHVALSDDYTDKIVDAFTKDEEGEYLLDIMYREVKLTPRRAARLALFIIDEKEYIRQFKDLK